MIGFHQIKGQEELKRELIWTARSPKMHHAHLFIGKMGYQTLSLAMAFLKYVYCTQKGETDSCNECANCHKIEHFSHVDVHYTFPSFDEKSLSNKLVPKFKSLGEERHWIFDQKDWLEYNDAKNLKIREAEIATIHDQFSLYSYESGIQTQVIWLFELFGKESNKLLKLLEEPNPNSLFILISENPNPILPTILSRCNLIKVPKLNADTVEEYILEQDWESDKAKIQNAVRYADGDLLEAKRYFEDSSGDFSLEHLVLEFLRGLDQFEQRNFNKVIKLIQVSKKLESCPRTVQLKFLEQLTRFYRNIIEYQVIGNINVSPEMQRAVAHFSKKYEIDQVESSLNEINQTMYALERFANPKFSFVSLAIVLGKVSNRQSFSVWNGIK